MASLTVSLLTACGSSGAEESGERSTSSTRPRRTSTTVRSTTSTTLTPVATTATTAPPATAAPPAGNAKPPAPPAAPPAPPAPYQPVAGYAGTVSPVDAARLPASWRSGCPVGPDRLRLLTLPHWGFDGGSRAGELVVHADVADAVVNAFKRLYDAGYPIERMVLVDVYGGSDDASMAANNTSAFNCRQITGGGRWSEHAYGKAIDINPIQNPYVSSGGNVQPPAGAPYVDRKRTDPGLIHAGDAVVQAFGSIGWGWGGNFNSIKDYQHFSASGR